MLHNIKSPFSSNLVLLRRACNTTKKHCYVKASFGDDKRAFLRSFSSSAASLAVLNINPEENAAEIKEEPRFG